MLWRMPESLAVVGSRKFYDYGVFETLLDAWVAAHGMPQQIVCGGAAGVDALAQRWADNHGIEVHKPEAIWHGQDAEAALTERIVDAATHILALPGEHSHWTHKTIKMATDKRKSVEVRTLPS